MSCTIVWFRNDLRIRDNPALLEASDHGPVLPVYIRAETFSAPGGALKWWLAHSLKSLSADLQTLGAPLILARGNPLPLLLELVHTTGATSVYWNERTGSEGRTQDETIARELRQRGITVRTFREDLLSDPRGIVGKNGPYRVFTAFWNHLMPCLDPESPLPPPSALDPPGRIPSSDRIDDWGWIPRNPDWAGEFPRTGTPGEDPGRRRLEAFLEHGLADYADNRDRSDKNGVSGLSPYIQAGEVSTREIAWRVFDRIHNQQGALQGGTKFLQELGWRAFSRSLLTHYPEMVNTPFQPAFSRFPWRTDPEGLTAWKRGRTGYPVVDAGMRQLWRTGWIPNRIRMIVASFLVKDLLISWEEGARWFMDTLVDADLAINTVSWQWVAGCGVDAAPYFRIFNPVLQGETHDPEGVTVRRWLPELAFLPDRFIHRPWEAPPSLLRDAGLIPGENWPAPIIDHSFARKRALDLFSGIKTRQRTQPAT